MDSRIVAKKLHIIRELAVEASWSIPQWECRLARYLDPGRYEFKGDWRPAKLPLSAPAGQTVFLRSRFTIPQRFRRPSASMDFHFDVMEGLLRVDGRPYAGLDTWHRRVFLPRAPQLTAEIEFNSVSAVCAMPGMLPPQGTFAGADLRLIDPEFEAFWHDVRYADETARLISDERRKRLLEAAVEDALLAVDLTQPREGLRRDIVNARRAFRKALAAIEPDPEAGGVYLAGHTHIDTAWLWTVRETVRKCSRTFSTACRLMERYPDFTFTCSQAQLYAFTKNHYPELYREIRKWVKTGRWETAGAMWVEADCNLSSGESLIRQILHGLRFFQTEFGTRPTMCWLPDVFGYPASLPTILRGCGIPRFFTYKLHWQARNPFPAHLFRWRGLDGSEVLAHVPNLLNGYNGNPTPDQIVAAWTRYAQKAQHPEVLFPFGWGDGGGGVTDEMMEMATRLKGQYPGLPRVRLGTAEAYFQSVEQAEPDLPVWDGELYLETHRGTYTTQARIKRANRKTEIALRDAEILLSLASTAGGRVKRDDLNRAWELTLLNQFHDILPGSSIAEVYTDALRDLAEAQDLCKAVQKRALGRWIRPSPTPDAVWVFNTLNWPRSEPLETPLGSTNAKVALQGPDERLYPTQWVKRQDGQTALLFQPDLPPCGSAVFRIVQEAAPLPSPLSISATRMENQYFRLRFNARGDLISLWDKRYRREVLRPGAPGNELQLLQDGPEGEDAWNVHATMNRRCYPMEGPVRIRILERGPIRATLQIERKHRRSRFIQDVRLYADLPRVDFVTRVDWHEQHVLLKAAFPLNIRATRATYEVAFGAVERPTHRNTSWDEEKFEVPAHRWADLSETGYGVSLLNDCKYGYDALDSTLRLTLLRGTTCPDPAADQGEHEFAYALYPHAGDWTQADTVRQGWAFNVSPVLVPIKAGASKQAVSYSFLSTEGLPVIIEALKPAADGRGLILRLYEPHGARGQVLVTAGVLLNEVRACSLVEEDAERIPLKAGAWRFDIKPFEIRTFRLLPAGHL